MRWTPGSGTRTRFALPVAPNRDHILRLGGSALVAHRAEVLIGNRPVGAIALKGGLHDYEVPIPASAVGGRQQATVALRYEKPVIPHDIDPAKYPTEGRACNLAIDWLQWSTANIAKGDKRTTHVAPKLAIRFTDPVLGTLKGEAVPSAGLRAMPLAAPAGKPLSLQQPGDVPRDILLPFGKGELLYVNGRFSDLAALDYWENLLTHWAKLPPALHVVGHDAIMSARLDADDTVLLLACNHDIAIKGQKLRLRLPVRDKLRLRLPVRDRGMGGRGSRRAASGARSDGSAGASPSPAVPLSEAMILSRDGQTYQPLKARTVAGHIVADDILNYYAVYQLAFAPVRVTLPKLEVCQGEKATVAATVENLTDLAVAGTLRFACVVPTLGGPAAEVALAPRESKKVDLTIEASKLCDWGTKTVTIELAFAGRRACLFRPCLVLRRPDVQLITRVIDPGKGRSIELSNGQRPGAPAAAARDARISLGEAQAQVEQIEEWTSATLEPRPRLAPTKQTELRPVQLDVSYRVGIGDAPRETKKLRAYLPAFPETFDAPTDAVFPVLVCNPSDEWLDHVAVDLEFTEDIMPWYYVRAADGRPAPGWGVAPVFGQGLGAIWLAALVPPRSARVYFVCIRKDPEKEDPPDVPTPLRVWTGETRRRERAGLTSSTQMMVSNARFRLILDRARGGTVTSLVSKRTGREYAAESFGAACGTFGQYDPRQPATTTVRFVRDALARQADQRARVEIVKSGGVIATLEVTGRAGPRTTRQAYTFVPWHAGFQIQAYGFKPQEGKPAEDLVTVDARFRAEHFTKTYPNFVGIVSDKEQPHFGWRRGAWVPECLTFMHPPDFTESISLLRVHAEGVARVRHGFWPERRPGAGKCTYARAEYVAAAGRTGVTLEVLLHRGHHHHAKRLGRVGAEREPVVIIPGDFKWGKRFKPIDTKFPKDWFSPYWHARAAVAAPGEKGWVAVATKALAEKMGGKPKAFRCVQVNEENDLAEREFEVSEEGERVIVDVDPRWGRTLHVYGSLEALPSPLMVRRTRRGIPLERFEKPAEGWQLGGCEVGAFGREGSKGVRLRVGEGGQPVVISNGAIAVQPETEYRLSFWARTQTQGASVRANFYSGPQYDFGQEAVPLAADGQWHRCEATVRAGRFPPSVRPVFRLWVLGRPQVIDVDDLELTSAVAAPPALAPSGVEVLR